MPTLTLIMRLRLRQAWWLICLISYASSQSPGTGDDTLNTNAEKVPDSSNTQQQSSRDAILDHATGTDVGSVSDLGSSVNSPGVNDGSSSVVVDSGDNGQAVDSGDNEDNMSYGVCGSLDGAVYHDGFCYTVFEDQMTWDEAQTSCKTAMIDGRLAEPPDAAAAVFLYHLMVSTGINNGGTRNKIGAWIGASKQRADRGFKWASNDVDMWDIPEDLQDNNPSDDEGCAIISRKRKVTGRSCDATRKRVCQVAVDPVCPKGHRYYDGYCYALVDEERGYYQAKKKCWTSYGSGLVEIHSLGTAAFLQEFIFEHAWTTISQDSADTVDLNERGIWMEPGQAFCVAARGVGKAILLVHSKDRQATECSSIITIVMNRASGSITGAVQVCDACSDQCVQEDFESKTPVSDWSLYCLSHDTKAQSVTASYTEGPDHTETLTFFDRSLQYGINDVELEAGLMDYQWRFPDKQDLSFYLSANAETGNYESGAAINYDYLGVTPHSFVLKSNANRLTFQTFPPAVKEVKNDVEAGIVVCQYKWGYHSYLGFVPLQLQTRSTLSISHRTDTVALLNFDPNIEDDGILTKFVVKPIKATSRVTIPLGGIYSANNRFVVRADSPINVQLFSRSGDLYSLSALILPWVVTGNEYVVSGPESNWGQLTIINQNVTNQVTIQIPQYREVFVRNGDMTYRVYQIHPAALDPFQLISIDFHGDISGSTISGTQRMAVFVSTSKADLFSQISDQQITQDFSFSQLLPATSMDSQYPGLAFVGANHNLYGARYKVVAMVNDTSVEMSDQPETALDLWGDTWTVSMPHGITPIVKSDNPVIVSLELSFSNMSCAVDLLPPRYWKDQYTIDVPSDYPTSSVYMTVESPTAAPQFKINNELFPVDCARVARSNYYSCHADLSTGIYSIASASENQTFSAYLLGAEPGLACFIRMAGIRHTAQKNNDYEVPTFQDPPEPCPNVTFPSAITTAPPAPTTDDPPPYDTYITTEASAPAPIIANNITTIYNETTLTTIPNTNNANNTTEAADAPTTIIPPTTEAAKLPLPLYPYQNSSLTEKEIMEEIREVIRKELAVDQRQVSSFVRKKISVKDDRTSSTTMGYVGIAVIAMTTGLLVIPDMTSMCVWVANWIGSNVKAV